MKKIYLYLILFGLTILPFQALAVNDVTLNGVVSWQFDSLEVVPITILGQSGGIASSLTVGSNYLDVTVDNGSDITFNTVGVNYFSLPFAKPVGVTYNPSCILGQIRILSTVNATIRLQVTSIKPVCPGGGGGASYIYPSNYSLVINNGAATTTSQSVNLTITGTDANYYLVSNYPSIIDTNWQAFTSPLTIPWTLTNGYGPKTVYVILKSPDNTTSNIFSATIEFVAPGEVIPQPPIGPSPIPGVDFGNLIMAPSSGKAVYYYGADAKRYVFPSEKTYFTWYSDWSNVKNITNEQLASIPFGGNVTYRPGVRMIKFESVANVYAVDSHSVLRWINSEQVARDLYGDNWGSMIDDLNVAFYFDYKFGADIFSSADYIPSQATLAAVNINVDKQLIK